MTEYEIRQAVMWVIGIGVALLLWWFLLSEQLREKQLKRWARSKRLFFNPGKDRSFAGYLKEFACLQDGDDNFSYNTCTGNWNGTEITVFDYCFCSGEGKYRSSTYFSGILIQSQYQLKHLYIRPENTLDKVNGFLGMGDVNFRCPEFDRKFYVKAADEQWAFDALSIDARKLLLNCNKRYHIQYDGRNIMIWDPKRKLTIKQIEQAADLGTKLVAMLPDYVKNDPVATD